MMAAPRLAFTIGIPAIATEPDLAGTLQSLKQSADAVGGAYEMLVAVNGSEEPAPAVAGARAFAAAAHVVLCEEPPAAAPDDAPMLRVLRLRERSKVAAWNAIRATARAPIIVFVDADVRVAPPAVGCLLARLAAAPALAAAAGREAAALGARDGIVARMAALPYRFDFGNVPGRLYALRTAAFPEPMPAHVLHEDAYLSVRLGRERFAKVDEAVVYLRPPTTWGEYLDQRVRNELGKLQLAAQFPELLRAHGFGATPWRAMLRGIRVDEYPLAALSLASRLYARVRARRQARTRGFDRGWAALPSTKAWEA
ncbi:MAG TPA: glycosyltransferase [Candidatus Binatia bacterium]|jgi:cellulose synthase/poly-beta-1,6-N-acetylglucosamine synthase-like glycosyltransferase